MANSSNFSTDNQFIVYWVEVKQNSQNLSKNTSNVTVKVWSKRTNTGYSTMGSGTVSCKINGASYSTSITSSQKITSTAICLFQKTLDISHGSDGSKTLEVSTSIKHDRFSSGTNTYKYVLTTIPRVSDFSLSSTNFTLGQDSVVVTIKKSSSSFTHKVYYKFYSINKCVYDGSGSSYTLKPSIDDCKQIPSATSGKGTIIVETWNGSKKIGSKSASFTAKVPSSVRPTFNGVSARLIANGVVESLGYIQNKSKCELSISGGSGSYGSTVTNYHIEGGGFTTNSASATTGVVTKSGSITYTAYVTDSRGRNSDSKTVTINVTPYSAPKLLEFSATRCLSNGEGNEDGTYAKVYTHYTYSPLNGSNTISAKLSYRKVGDTNFIQCSQTPSPDGSVAIGDGQIDTSNEYDIMFSLRDDVSGEVIETLVLPSAFVTIDFKQGGKGIAIGKTSQKDNLFDVNMETAINGNLSVENGNLYVNGNSKAIRVTTGTTDVAIQNTASGKWLQLKDNGDLTYGGIKVLRDVETKPLWQGYHHMSKSETVKPSKRLSECNTGWIIVWSDWNDGGKGENFNFVYSYIPKNTIWKDGQNTCFALSTGEGDDTYTNKTLYIYDDRFTGNDNNKKGTSYDVVIRCVLEF